MELSTACDNFKDNGKISKNWRLECMKVNERKILCVVLALLMLISITPFPVLAESIAVPEKTAVATNTEEKPEQPKAEIKGKAIGGAEKTPFNAGQKENAEETISETPDNKAPKKEFLLTENSRSGNSEEDIAAAQAAVDKITVASGNKKLEAVEEAESLINALADSEEKTDLLTQLQGKDIRASSIILTWKSNGEDKSKVLYDEKNNIGVQQQNYDIDLNAEEFDDRDSIQIKFVIKNSNVQVIPMREDDLNINQISFMFALVPQDKSFQYSFNIDVNTVKKEVSKTQWISEIIESLTQFYKDTSEDWSAMALSALGKQQYVDESALIAKAKEVATENKVSTDLERITISLSSLGYDVTEFPDSNGNNLNLINMIGNYGGSIYGSDLGTLNGYIFALIAYDSGKYETPNVKWDRDKIIDYILNHQLSPAGWNLENEGYPDVDITAMTIQALAPYYSKPKVKKAVNSALDWLSSVQKSDGSFAGFGAGPNSNSTAMVVVALNNLGLDADTEPRFVKEDGSALDGLLSFATGTNKFGYTDNTKPNGMATEQSFRALIGYQQKKNVYLFPKPTKSFGDVVTANKLNIIRTPKTEYTVGDTIDLSGLKVSVEYSDGSIKYPTVDQLTIRGLDTETSGKKLVYVSYAGVNGTFSVNVRDKIKPIEPVDPEKPDSGESDKPKEKKAYISVVVPAGPTVYPSGRVMQAKKAFPIVEGKDTAFSLLQKTGLSYNYNYHPVYEGVYVSSIEGLAEFDGGPYSGWMYRVNGSFPNFSSSLYKVKDGDYVEWLYTRDLGKDVGGYVDGVEDDDGTGNSTKAFTIKSSQGGIVVPSGRRKLKKDESLTLTFTPDSGYVLTDIKIDGTSIGIADKLTIKYENVKDNSVIQAVFKKEADLTEEEKQQLEAKKNIELPIVKEGQAENSNTKNKIERFTDVKDHWAYDYIKYVVEKGYFKGTSETTFEPNADMTRGMFVTVFGRMENVSETPTETEFDDVSPEQYYSAHIKWANENNIVKGVGFGKFEPNREITREEMAQIMANYLQYKNIEIDKSHDQKIEDESEVSDWAKDSVNAMYSMGLLKGRTDGKFHPKDKSTRGEIATIIFRIDSLD